MKTAILQRIDSDDQGTFGALCCENFSAKILELPWRNNQPNKSCVKAGLYHATLRYSPHFRRRLYWFYDVEDRGHILAHNGNLAGDTDLGWRTHSLGCLIMGKYFGKLNIGGGKFQRAVLLSGPTLRRFMNYMNGEDFEIYIKDVP